MSEVVCSLICCATSSPSNTVVLTNTVAFFSKKSVPKRFFPLRPLCYVPFSVFLYMIRKFENQHACFWASGAAVQTSTKDFGTFSCVSHLQPCICTQHREKKRNHDSKKNAGIKSNISSMCSLLLICLSQQQFTHAIEVNKNSNNAYRRLAIERSCHIFEKC